MATIFPLPLSSFADQLRITSMNLHLPSVIEESQTAGGEIIRADLGANLWQGSIELWPMRGTCARKYRAQLDLFQRPGASFLMRPLDFTGIVSDPDRAGVAGVTLANVNANGRDLDLSGLPDGLVLQAGDYLSFTYGSGPVRYAFHQIVSQSQTAGSSGTMTVEVIPAVRVGWAAAAAVSLVKPQFKAVLRQRDPGGTRMLGLGAGAKPIHSGMSFDFIQTLR